jgi:hypothetical protein
MTSSGTVTCNRFELRAAKCRQRKFLVLIKSLTTEKIKQESLAGRRRPVVKPAFRLKVHGHECSRNCSNHSRKRLKHGRSGSRGYPVNPIAQQSLPLPFLSVGIDCAYGSCAGRFGTGQAVTSCNTYGESADCDENKKTASRIAQARARARICRQNHFEMILQLSLDYNASGQPPCANNQIPIVRRMKPCRRLYSAVLTNGASTLKIPDKLLEG